MSSGGFSGRRKRTRRCGECEGCLMEDCGRCDACQDKPKYGGLNQRKQACFMRECIIKMAEHEEADKKRIRKKRGGGPKQKPHITQQGEQDNDEKEKSYNVVTVRQAQLETEVREIRIILDRGKNVENSRIKVADPDTDIRDIWNGIVQENDWMMVQVQDMEDQQLKPTGKVVVQEKTSQKDAIMERDRSATLETRLARIPVLDVSRDLTTPEPDKENSRLTLTPENHSVRDVLASLVSEEEVSAHFQAVDKYEDIPEEEILALASELTEFYCSQLEM